MHTLGIARAFYALVELSSARPKLAEVEIEIYFTAWRGVVLGIQQAEVL